LCNADDGSQKSFIPFDTHLLKTMASSAIYTYSVRPSAIGNSHARPESDQLGRTEGYTGLYEEINKRLAEGYEIASFHQSGLSSEGYLLITVILRKE